MHSGLVTRPRLWLRSALLSLSIMLIMGLAPASSASQPLAHTLKMDMGQTKAKIESKGRGAGTKAELKLEFDNRSHKFKIEYESKDRGQELDAEVEIELTELIEWRDVNGNGVYDPRVRGETVQRIKLKDLSPAFLVREETADGLRLVGVSAALDKHPELLVTFAVSVHRDLLEGGTVVLGPDAADLGIRIVGFPYQADDTSLALGVKLKREVEDKVTGSARTAAQTVTARSDQYRAFFGWSDTVMVDGRQVGVGTSFVKRDAKRERKNPSGKKLEIKESSELYLLYPRGTALFHEVR